MDVTKFISANNLTLFSDLINEEPRGKPRGIFFGEEVYYTGGGPYPRNKMINIFGGDVNLSAPRGGVWTPAFQSTLLNQGY